MANRTIYMTSEETAQIDGLPRFGDKQQAAMLDLRKRTGIRYGVSVKQGYFSIVTVAYEINKKGKPHGSATVEVVRGGLRQHELLDAILSI